MLARHGTTHALSTPRIHSFHNRTTAGTVDTGAMLQGRDRRDRASRRNLCEVTSYDSIAAIRYRA
jgi:hypothetical protein